MVECVAPLLFIMINANNVGYRQFAAILLKRNITTHYVELPQDQRKELRDTVLARYFEESERIVRRNIGNLIAIIAKVALRDNEWNELLAILSEKTHPSQILQTRATGLTLLGMILDISGEYLDKNYTDLFIFLNQTINDQCQEVKFLFFHH